MDACNQEVGSGAVTDNDRVLGSGHWRVLLRWHGEDGQGNERLGCRMGCLSGHLSLLE